MIYPQKWKPNNEGYNRNHPPAQNAMPADLFGVECQQNCFGEEGQWESIVGKEPSSFVWGEKGCRQYVNKYVAGMESGQSSGYAIYSCVLTCHVRSRITANKGSKLYVRCYFLNWCRWLYVNLLKLVQKINSVKGGSHHKEFGLIKGWKNQPYILTTAVGTQPTILKLWNWHGRNYHQQCQMLSTCQ